MAQMFSRVFGRIPQLINGIADAGIPKLQTAWSYMKVELRPPSLDELPEVRKRFGNIVNGYRTQKWKQLTVKEAAINAVVVVEVACWFAVGECIGKRSLVGYQIPGAVDFEAHL